jgi:hypothetical protein
MSREGTSASRAKGFLVSVDNSQHFFFEDADLSRETEMVTPAARRAQVYVARAKMAEDWSAKTADAELRQSWLKIAEEYRLLARAL